MPKQTLRRVFRRIGGLHFPPWVPVAVIIAVVVGILGFVVFARGAAAAPSIGDHWHATYETIVCGEPQPNVRQWSGGVHTHGSGTVHLHPQTRSEEGVGARLVKWFEYGGDALGTGGTLAKSELQLPGEREVWKNGDGCPDGTEGVLQVFVNTVKMDDWSRYIPQDGDHIRIVFGPEEEDLPQEGIQIPAEEATREVTVEAADRGQPALDSVFDPDAITIAVGEAVKVNVSNTGSVTHNLRITGIDQEYGTADDFVAKPPDQASTLVKPGESGFTVVRIDEPGRYAFRCDIHPNVQIGTLIVRSEQSSSSQEEAPAAEGTLAE
jgi:plastocyanin